MIKRMRYPDSPLWDTAYYTILTDFMEDIDYGTWKKKRDSEKKG